MKTGVEFENFFNQTLLPDLELLDKRRKQIIYRVLFIVSCVLSPIIAISIVTEFFIGVAIGVAISLLLFFFWARDKDFLDDFKLQVINPIVYFISPPLTYEPKGHINLSEFIAGRIFLTSVDRYRGDDLVYGKIDKTEFRFSEFMAEYKTTTTDSKGRTKTTWHTIFRGLFFIADFNKDFSGSTVVLPNSFGRGFGFMKKIMGMGRREKLVNLEDVDFAKQFTVYSDDQIKARYILSPSLMTRIKHFRAKHNNNVCLSFVDSKMYLAISHRKNLFEPRYLKPITNFSVVKTYFDDLSLAVGIVEDMNLNIRIWTKQ